MRTTVNINDDILKKAQEISQISEKTKLINMALQSLVEKFAAEQLRKLEGSEKQLKTPPRRK